MQFKSFGFSDPGRTRGLNEDSYLCNAKERLFLVADGMGGHSSGDRASKTVVESTEDYVIRSRSEDKTWPLMEFHAELTPNQNRLLGALISANRQLINMGKKDLSLKGMGTTLVGAIIDEEKRLAIVNAGDSRLYGIREGKIKQYTTDHTLVGEEQREGRLSKEDARRHPQRHILTSGLGIDQKPRIDSFLVDIEPKDLFLLCSDGLHDMLEDGEILEIISSIQDRSLYKIGLSLVLKANLAGGLDNITVVLFSFQ